MPNESEEITQFKRFGRIKVISRVGFSKINGKDSSITGKNKNMPVITNHQLFIWELQSLGMIFLG